MNVRLAVTASMFALSLTACATQEDAAESDGTWVGTITIEGNVTTVANESGSVWGGTATLVEEASIGVETGEDPYMFGNITGIYATDEEILVVDEQVPVIRVYDYAGQHLRDLGAEGQGPGEFQNPRWVTVAPDGRVFTTARRNRRINVYGPEPGAVDTWPLGENDCCMIPMVITDDGVVWVEANVSSEEPYSYGRGFLAHGPDGPADERWMVPAYQFDHYTVRVDGRELEGVVYAPQIVAAMSPAGLMIAGSSDRYRFEMVSPDGAKTVVHRYWDPIPLIETETSYAIRFTREQFSQTGRDVAFDWDGRVPEHKPAFWSFLPTADGNIWVIRPGPGEAIPGCDPTETVEASSGTKMPATCFTASWIIDAFDGEGRYLGEVPMETESFWFTNDTFVRDDAVITVIQDPDGTIMVKRYRLVLPGEW